MSNTSSRTRLISALAAVLVLASCIWIFTVRDQIAAAQPGGGSSPPPTYPPPTTRPVVYIASPYSKGDPAINTHFQCQVFDQMLNDGVVWPVAPLWSHFQHTMYPRQYQDWVAYDAAMIPRYDACVRLNAEHPELKYSQAIHPGPTKKWQSSSASESRFSTRWQTCMSGQRADRDIRATTPAE